ncbi:MAG: ATP-grasp domain-containing protein [Ignavibacteriae bacterium]|nr:MAG: ATP-grasp domain-containing protein [Ignavibacteriota bacterium]
MSKRKLTIAITGLNNTDNPGPGIPVIRGILDSKLFDARIIGLAYENLEPGIYMRDLVDKSYHIPYPSAGSDILLKRIEHINKIEKIDVLIPNFDAELYSFIKSSEKLKKMGIATFLPTMEQFEERHKWNLCEFGKKYNVKVPSVKSFYSEAELYKAAPGLTFPVFVKGKFYDAYLATNAEQLRMHFYKLYSKWGFPVLLQQYIRGTEVNVVALGDGHGKTIGAVPMRKQYITDKGKAWAGITLDDEKLIEITHKIIKKSKWRGGMELELIKDEMNNLYLIEINPRLPAWVYLAVGAGQNLPEALVKLALGLKTNKYTKYDIGKLFIRYSYDLICKLEEFEQLSLYGEL